MITTFRFGNKETKKVWCTVTYDDKTQKITVHSSDKKLIEVVTKVYTTEREFFIPTKSKNYALDSGYYITAKGTDELFYMECASCTMRYNNLDRLSYFGVTVDN